MVMYVVRGNYNCSKCIFAGTRQSIDSGGLYRSRCGYAILVCQSRYSGGSMGHNFYDR